MGPRNSVLDGGQERTNPFAAARGGKSAMRILPNQINLNTCYGLYERTVVQAVLKTDNQIYGNSPLF